MFMHLANAVSELSSSSLLERIAPEVLRNGPAPVEAHHFPSFSPS